jgi:hypothetical protein
MAATTMNASTTDQERQRAIFFLWLTAQTLLRIDAKLADLVTLQQQANDLLRRVLAGERKP